MLMAAALPVEGNEESKDASGKSSDSEADRVPSAVLTVIQDCEEQIPEGERGVPFRDIVENVPEVQGLTESEIEEWIDKLCYKGKVYEPNTGVYRTT
jgi:DNA replicative helicase MCM subunit Mcm2 (Cdc46/Mcm family)